ncbi:hypothetical protein KPSA1_06149 [Pseudomonas syringae pv. actinidiae]|uniref:Uncharacterized protein n=1 Tax=Pseudomonas syringae pv. actinidiae TaxID=103796 RepID=A0A2V0QPW1_PSESF|nr:hypothetical protein KPSA1_06149 [Pseudomonas syringae pv. actinidiae]
MKTLRVTNLRRAAISDAHQTGLGAGCQSISAIPCLLAISRAATNSRSDSLLMYASPAPSNGSTAFKCWQRRSALRARLRQMCAWAISVEPPGKMKFSSGPSSSFHTSMAASSRSTSALFSAL